MMIRKALPACRADSDALSNEMKEVIWWCEKIGTR
jgi:hypothetical protein